MEKTIAVADGKIYLLKSCVNDEVCYDFPDSFQSPPEYSEVFRFNISDGCYIAFDVPGDFADDGLELIELREAFGKIPANSWKAAAKACELLNWSRHTSYCASCGGRLRRDTEISKKCERCGREFFPTLSPCVIVLVTRGEGADEEALLVHAATFRRPFFGLVAGFVETGESLEEAVAREVMEETGLEIEDVTYFGSQSWAFPHQLMIGFTARWKSGEVRFADGELTAGGFFHREDLPLIPTPPSIARQMIDRWFNAYMTIRIYE